jgi:hypothetical protein
MLRPLGLTLLLTGLLVPAQNIFAQNWSPPGQTEQVATPEAVMPYEAPAETPSETPAAAPSAPPAVTPSAAPTATSATTPAAAPSAAPAPKTKARGRKSAPEPEVPQTPPPPPTLEQQPPVPPQVSYQNGQLTIDSQNATLSQVLRSVQSKTGASIDIPPGAGNERVVARLGPGKPKDVLASLLNGSKFNYVILGAPNQSGGVQKVILLSKTAGTGDNSPSVAAAQNNIHAPMVSQAVEPPPEDEYPPPDQESDNQQLQPGQPGVPGSENLAPDTINASPLMSPGSRTPEQMLQELQKMQQQQQQYQQQLNPVNQQPAAAPFPSQPGTASPQPQ